MSHPGTFITIEGVEGAGKSTQSRLLASALSTAGVQPVLTREPGGTPLAERIRDLVLDPAFAPVDPECELFLYLAARTDHVRRQILPRLAAGDWVLCDRFTDATVAYQGYGRGLDVDWVREQAEHAGQVHPDLTLLLDLDVDAGLARVRARGAENRLDAERVEFHRAVRKGYLQLAADQPRRIVIVDAAGGTEEVHRRVLNVVSARLGSRLQRPLAPVREAVR
ncbi:MAG: dTMP kinase [Nitrospirota bacterium]|nr:dTMP kinase [Nitrospirota bacterium]